MEILFYKVFLEGFKRIIESAYLKLMEREKEEI